MKETYALYKSLKDAGFPQEGDGGTAVSPECLGGKECGGQCIVYIPTLSEMVAACGDRFSTLMNCYEEGWRAYGKNTPKIFYRGSTPEEAVANLCLALNKKS